MIGAVKGALTNQNLSKGFTLENITSKATSGVTKLVTALPKALVSAVGSAATGTAGALGRRVNNSIAGSSLGNVSGVTPKPTNPKLFKALAGTAVAGGMAAADSTLWEPKVEPNGEGSGRVWGSLQGN